MAFRTLFAVLALLTVVGSAVWGVDVKVGTRTFIVPEGFTVELVAGPPAVERPVVGDFDEEGRLYVTEVSGTGATVQKQLEERPHRVVRLEAAGSDGVLGKASLFADRLMLPEGALWRGGALYVGAPPSIWKITDRETRVEWFSGKTLTGCANDIHGPYGGPDGWIYWCKGGFAKQTYTLENGKTFTTRAAHIFRARPDGSGIEPVMTAGCDNPVGVIFTPGGERIFSCTFLQNPANGRRDGLIHAVYGGVWGKVHDVIEEHPRSGPEVMPVLSHLGPAASCGLARVESDAFGREYQGNLFTACFNLHKVTRHVLTPEGATFASRDSDFMVCDDVEFHPTDVIEDADGSLLVFDTGGWYHLCCPTSKLEKAEVTGGIYRVRKVDAPRVEDPRGLKMEWGTASAGELVKRLDGRPAVRKRAIEVLAGKAEDALGALGEAMGAADGTGAWRDAPLVRLNAVWTATRINHPRARRLVRDALSDSDETVRQAALNSISLWRDREAMGAVSNLLESKSAQNRRAAAEALGRIGDGAAVGAILAAAERENDRFLDHSLTYALIEIADAKKTTAALESVNARARRAAMVALDQMSAGTLEPKFVAEQLGSRDAALRESAAWVISRHGDWGDALAGDLRKRLRAMGGGAEAEETGELQRQLASLSKSAAVEELLAETAADGALPLVQRRAAMAAMAEAPLKAVPEKWVAAVEAAFATKDTQILRDAIRIAGKVGAKDPRSNALTAALRGLAANGAVDTKLRLAALSAIPSSISVDADGMELLLGQLRGEPATLRLEAAEILSRANLDEEQLRRLAAALTTVGPLEINRVLAAFDQSRSPAVGEALLAGLGKSKSLAAVRADQLAMHLARFGPDVVEEARPLLAKLNPDAAAQKERLDRLTAALPGGEAARGRAVFNSAKASCSACHAIGYVGGNVGPDLTSVGKIRSERDLLESIVFPSATFVQSFEPMIIETKTAEQSGIVRKNDAEEIVLITGPNQEVRIAKADVVEMRPGRVSVMPEGLDQTLTPQELADLVSFLRACR